jgi:uncharacterized membrane protein YcaP (DUF421 family)
MEAKTVQALLNLALLQAIVFLFVFIKYYFSASHRKPNNALPEHEIAISIVMGFMVFFVIINDTTSLASKYVFFILSVAIHTGSCLLILRHQKGKPMMYRKSLMIFHNGSFLRGAIVQNKLSEKEILKTLNTKGVFDLGEVDTIILEPDGELSVIFKKKSKNAA